MVPQTCGVTLGSRSRPKWGKAPIQAESCHVACKHLGCLGSPCRVTGVRRGGFSGSYQRMAGACYYHPSIINLLASDRPLTGASHCSPQGSIRLFGNTLLPYAVADSLVALLHPRTLSVHIGSLLASPGLKIPFLSFCSVAVITLIPCTLPFPRQASSKSTQTSNSGGIHKLALRLI